MIVREIERSVREAGHGDVVTMQTCLRAVARACIFTDAVRKASAPVVKPHRRQVLSRRYVSPTSFNLPPWTQWY